MLITLNFALHGVIDYILMEGKELWVALYSILQLLYIEGRLSVFIYIVS